METRSNQILVGAIVLGLLTVVIIFTIWLARLSDGHHRDYDILFRQSVEGLAKGSPVSFSGVPVGQIKQIAIMPESPEFVRVRIAIDETVPVTVGTTATVQSVGFTGVAQIQLEGSIKGAPALEANGPYGVPVIPTKQGALGALLNNAPQLLERLSTLTARLNETFSDSNQKHLSNILTHVDDLSGTLAKQGPEITATLAEAKVTLHNASIAADAIGKLAGTTNELLDKDGRPMMKDLRRTIASAERSMAVLEATLNEAKPGVKTFSNETLPQLNLLITDLQATSESLRAVTTRLDEEGAKSVLKGRKLPDYEQ